MELDTLTITAHSTVLDALRAIDRGGIEIALVVAGDGKLTGIVTDGDCRRALIAGTLLADSILPHVNRSPRTVTPAADRAAVLDLMQAHIIGQVPVVDDSGRPVGVHTLQRIIGSPERQNIAVIMAGGRGTRLAPLTRNMPKPMVKVAGRPILERLVIHLVGGGVRQIVLSVNYLADMIRDHFGDGSAFGASIAYVQDEADNPLGTAGCLPLVGDAFPDLSEPLLVMNGDLVTEFSVAQFIERHESSGAIATAAVVPYSHDVPYGVIETDSAGLVRAITEKPRASWTTNAGIYLLDPSIIDRIPRGQPSQLPEVLAGVVADGLAVATWELQGDWHDVGRHVELAQARGLT